LLLLSVFATTARGDEGSRNRDSSDAAIAEQTQWRGNIYDRTGLLLSASGGGVLVGVDPRGINLKDERKLVELAKLTSMAPMDLKAKILAAGNAQYVELKRDLAPELEARIVDLDMPAVRFSHTTTRVHAVPFEAFALLGEVDATGTGVSGLELMLNDTLKWGSVDDSQASLAPPQATLTLDARLQLLAHLSMQKLTQWQGVAHADLILIDAATGDLLAAAQASAQDEPNPAPGIKHLISRAFEPGTAFAPFIIASGLQVGAIAPQTRLRLDNSALLSILDADVARGKRSVPVSELLARPSNLSIATVGMRIKQTTLSDMLASLGVARGPALGIPGEGAGSLSALPPWSARDQALIATGRRFTLTLPQLARAYAMLTAQGRLPTLNVTHALRRPNGKQIIAPEVAAAVMTMLGDKRPSHIFIAHTNDISHTRLGITYRRKQTIAVGMSSRYQRRIVAALLLEVSAIDGEHVQTRARDALARTLRGVELLLDRQMTLKLLFEEANE
jgi:cell division protein FtsI (penicillin-binding protein 3)